MKRHRSSRATLWSPSRPHTEEAPLTVLLFGNPNVGKSTLSNRLTGMHQHTGNWPGKTVESARGVCRFGKERYLLVDLPGTYAIAAHSPEEEVAREALLNATDAAVIVVCDATAPERSLYLTLQIMAYGIRPILCVNLLEEAKKKGIHWDCKGLEARLGIPVVPADARKKASLRPLLEAIRVAVSSPPHATPSPTAAQTNDSTDEERVAKEMHAYAAELARTVCTRSVTSRTETERRWDRFLTGKISAYPAMLLLLALVFWLTLTVAGRLSEGLASLLDKGGDVLSLLLGRSHAPPWLCGAILDGVYSVLSTVVAVMLPPMAIFFPLFTLLEDLGYLPRVAYNLDRPFCRCRACGKQALTMCMGFGCNAAGVVGCRIIDSPRERLLAILTNSLVPCNGRFPALITLITAFFVFGAKGGAASTVSALLLTLLILFSVGATLVMTKLLSHTLLRGQASAFTLELPPFRRPQVGKILVRSVLDRTLSVLARAAITAAPMGLLLWGMASLPCGDTTLLRATAAFLDPFGRAIGMDGVLLLAFVLGLPANELVLPIAVMIYRADGVLSNTPSATEMKALFLANGWTHTTALCVLLFFLFHWPCATTLLTVRKETGSLRYTLLAALLPTALGILLCAAVAAASRLF